MTTSLPESDLHLLVAKKENPPDTRAAIRPRASVLVIDDESEVRSVVASILIRSGFEVEAATDGAAGWEALARQSFDLVITDLVMPRLNGLELLRRLRAANPSLPVIAMSGFSPWNAAEIGQHLRPGVYLDKPFTLETLLDAVNDLLPPVSPPAGAPAPELGTSRPWQPAGAATSCVA